MLVTQTRTSSQVVFKNVICMYRDYFSEQRDWNGDRWKERVGEGVFVAIL